MAKRIEVVAGVIITDGKVFVAQRGYGEFKGGWEFPGGKVEEGESLETALKRELREELDVDVSVGRLIKTIEYDYPNFHLTLHCLETKIVSGEPKLLEHESARWVDGNEVEKLAWLPADIEMIPELKKMLNFQRLNIVKNFPGIPHVAKK